jgi:error-prone DNA polymerase
MAYVELHCHSNFSLLDGASHPEELVSRAAELGMKALALTDHDAVYGAPRFVRSAETQGIKPILGAELTLSGDHHLTLLVENQVGWHNLCYLISRARHVMPKGEAMLVEEELVGCTDGLIALSGCRKGKIAAALLAGDRDGAMEAARYYKELFGRDNFWIELQRHYSPGDNDLVGKLVALASYLQLGCVATNNIHYAVQDRHRLQDTLVSIRHLITLDEAARGIGLHTGDTRDQIRLGSQENPVRRANSEFYLKSNLEMEALFPDQPEAIANTGLLADRCHFGLQYGLQDLPEFPTPHGMSSGAYLRRLCQEALLERFPNPNGNKLQQQARKQLVHELEVIELAGLPNYFLIVWDIVRFARNEGIRCQGRGSSANSLVAYLLYISPIDPIAHDLVFERFLSAERQVVPDIDIDFDARRREEVIQYIYERYGAEHTAMACTFVTFRSRSALRDISKALALQPEVVAVATRALEDKTAGARDQGLGAGVQGVEVGTNRERGKAKGEKRRWLGSGLRGTAPTAHWLTRTPVLSPEESDQLPNLNNDGPSSGQRPATSDQRPELDDSESTNLGSSSSLLLDLAYQIEGFPRHLGIHSGGMIITGPPMMGRMPTEPATMEDRVVVQWDKDGLEDAGLVKIDILGLRMLSAITESLDLIEEMTGSAPDLDNLPFTDPAVFEMIGRADTVGVFQVESRAQAQMLPRMKPNCFADLIVAISLIRPGPIQGNMVHPYLRRRLGLEPVTYAHPSLQPALEETMGVILFQEQVLKVARDLAGFSAGQGEQLRRALGSKRAGEAIELFHDDFISGAEAQGVTAEVAETVFDLLRAFGGYSFAKSHAAAFSVIVYQSAWLKHYHFVPFYTALLNNQPMGFWNPAVLVGEAKRNDIQVLPVDLHQSQAKCKPVPETEGGGIRLGFNYVKSLKEEHVERIVVERSRAKFTDLDDFYWRVRPGRLVTENLIMAGAMDSWGIPRRQLIWELGTLHDQEGELDLIFTAEEVSLPSQSPAEAMLGEQAVQGLSTGDHVMVFYRKWMEDRGILGSERLAECANGQRVRVAGLVVVHQAPPTAKGHHFITLEDEAGLMNIIIRPRVHNRYRRVLHGPRLLLFEGDAQREGEVISILARRVAVLRDVSQGTGD